MELNERLQTVKNAFISESFSLFSAGDIETICGLFVPTSSASASAKSFDVWQYFGPLYCEYRTRQKFMGRKSLSCSRSVLFLVKVHFRCVNYRNFPFPGGREMQVGSPSNNMALNWPRPTAVHCKTASRSSPAV